MLSGMKMLGVPKMATRIIGIQKMAASFLTAAVALSVNELRTMAMKLSPEITGELKRSHFVILPKKVSLEPEAWLDVRSSYALAVEEGTNRFPGRYWVAASMDITEISHIARMRNAMLKAGRRVTI